MSLSSNPIGTLDGGDQQVNRLIGYVWGPVNAEDIAAVPGSEWVVTSGMVGQDAPLGRLYAVNRDDHSSSELFPFHADYRIDEDRFGAIESLDPSKFEPHGIDVWQRPDGVVELYVVNHGWRESVEVFEIVLEGRRPALRWIGAAVLPEPLTGNDVAAAGDGGFALSVNETDPTGPFARSNLPDSGAVMAWTAPAGWTRVPGSEINSANGIALSLDGKWMFLGGWRSASIKKISRIDGQSETVSTGILTDNITWAADGSLWAAGPAVTPEQFFAARSGPQAHLGVPSRVLRVDPETLTMDSMLDYPGQVFTAATTGLQLAEEIWVGTAHGPGLARFTMPAG